MSENENLTNRNYTSLNIEPANSVFLEWGFDMKGIHAEGRCPVCQKTFKFDTRRGYICAKHFTKPPRFIVDIFSKGSGSGGGPHWTEKLLELLLKRMLLKNKVKMK